MRDGEHWTTRVCQTAIVVGFMVCIVWLVLSRLPAPGKDWIPVIAGIGAFCAAGVALGNVIIQNRNARRGRALDFLYKLSTDFDATEMRKNRVAAADAILSNSDLIDRFDEILDFFEFLAIFIGEGDIPPVLAWEVFDYWVGGYEGAARAAIARHREEGRHLYQHVLDLLDRFKEIREQRPPRASAATQLAFLQGESALAIRE